jgi:hypothetical protein
MAPARLTVAIVTFRPDPRLLERAIRSLAEAAGAARDAASLAAARLYLVDNGPPDSSAAVRSAAASWPASLGSCEVVSGHGNIGYGRANNLVLGRLDSDFHLVMNPDVELDRGALVNALAAFAAHPDVGLVAPAAFGEDGARQYLCKRFPSLWVLFLRGFAPAFLRRRYSAALRDYEMRDAIGEDFLKGIPLASGCFMLVRTPLLARLGGFDPRFFMYFEDYDLSLRLGREAALAYVPQARIVHHGGEASRKGLRHVAWFAQSAWRFFATHGWKIA